MVFSLHFFQILVFCGCKLLTRIYDGWQEINLVFRICCVANSCCSVWVQLQLCRMCSEGSRVAILLCQCMDAPWMNLLFPTSIYPWLTSWLDPYPKVLCVFLLHVLRFPVSLGYFVSGTKRSTTAVLLSLFAQSKIAGKRFRSRLYLTSCLIHISL